MTATVNESDRREESGASLLRSAATMTYDPVVDIDWDAPLDPDKLYVPEHRSTLYGTPLWASMSNQQRMDLTRHEIASIASMGIWFETILMQMLVRRAYDRDPRTSNVQFTYTEIGDECRHSVMFAKLIDKLETPHYKPVSALHRGGRLLKTISNGPMCFAGALFVEEILDQLQREAMVDESVQPLVRAVSRVHVVEEARHMRFAREETAIEFAGQGVAAKEWSKLIVGATAFLSSTQLVHPHVYTNAGLDSAEARKQAAANPHWRATKQWAARRVRESLEEIDMITGPGRWLWKRAGLLDGGPIR
ncbi:AurF N-oxygenase family protein [Solicola gregarius]|uniref:Diiron oxygenase n=1 Tax=Solicola gregarius TaxID=2908642 RepID=A0AA46YJH5_9ACTN|nr:diiron oxygenase [Solicola gregarius]UYM03491.1 diiron oxygenase [Solicola gregarius]